MIVGKVRSLVSGSSRHFGGSGLRVVERPRVAASRARAFWLPALVALASGCLGPLPREAASYGRPNHGVLLQGVALANDPAADVGFVLARPADDTRWGTPAMIGMLERAARRVRNAFPGGSPLRVGDVSARYRSHRSGRDVDELFFLATIDGLDLPSSGFFAFDRRGLSRAGEGAKANFASLDVPRNWELVRALLADPEALVQWIFCADGIKARLLAYAAAVERDPQLLVRAAYVLHEPSYGNPHDDHFHVRIACSARDRALGCIDDGPIWPWLRNDHEKTLIAPGAPDDDEALLGFLLAD